MTETLVIWLNNDPGRTQWLVLDEHGSAGDVHHGTLSDASAHAANPRKVRVLVPGTEVLMLKASIPTRNNQKMLQALPFALEDQLAGHVEDQHFAVAARRADGKIPVAVVARDRMAAWLSQLADAGMEADSLTPDFLCLPLHKAANPPVLAIGAQAEGILLRTEAAHGCRVQAPLAAEILRQHFSQTGALPDTVDFYCESSDNSSDVVASLLEKAREKHNFTWHEHAGDLFPVLARNATRPALDLLQGHYKKRNENIQWWRPWRLPAALAACLLVVTLGMQISQYIVLKNKSDALLQQMNAVMQQAFPGARKSTIPRADMESRLMAMQNRGETGSGFLPLVQQVGMALSQIPDTQLSALSYRGGQMEITLLADSVQSLDQLKTLLAKNGSLHVEIQAANNRDDKVEGRLLIVPAGGA